MARYFSEQTLLDMRDKDMNYVYDLTDLEQYLAGLPTADVVPKSDVEEAVKKVVSATDKVICEAKVEVAWEIFDKVDEIAYRYLNDADYSGGDMIYDLNELKKKCTEEK